MVRRPTMPSYTPEQVEALVRRVQELEDENGFLTLRGRIAELEDWQKRAMDYLPTMSASYQDLIKDYWRESDQLSANIVIARLNPLKALIAEAKE
jgi:deoxyadenosine/deoxycytidine kinase